jgi:hypothetical protein
MRGLRHADVGIGQDHVERTEPFDLRQRQRARAGRWLKVDPGGRCVYEIDTVERDFASKISRKGFRLVSNDEDAEGRSELIYVAPYIGGSFGSPIHQRTVRLAAGRTT